MNFSEGVGGYGGLCLVGGRSRVSLPAVVTTERRPRNLLCAQEGRSVHVLCSCIHLSNDALLCTCGRRSTSSRLSQSAEMSTCWDFFRRWACFSCRGPLSMAYPSLQTPTGAMETSRRSRGSHLELLRTSGWAGAPGAVYRSGKERAAWLQTGGIGPIHARSRAVAHSGFAHWAVHCAAVLREMALCRRGKLEQKMP